MQIIEWVAFTNSIEGDDMLPLINIMLMMSLQLYIHAVDYN